MRLRILGGVLLLVVLSWAGVHFGLRSMFHQGDSGSELFARTRGARLQAELDFVIDPRQEPTPADDRPALSEETIERLGALRQSWQEMIEVDTYGLALEDANKMVALAPQDELAHLILADTRFFMGDFKDSVAAYDRAIEIEPTLAERLWQRGIAQYYAGQFEAGEKQFSQHQNVNAEDVENAVWHLLCAAQVSSVEAARKELIEVQYDRRVPMSQIYDLYAGRGPLQAVFEAAESTEKVVADSPRHYQQQYYANLYVGLYHEMMGEPEKSLKCIQAAAENCPFSKQEFMGQVARVHLKARRQTAGSQ